MSVIFEKTSDDIVAARVGSSVYAVIERGARFIIMQSYTGSPIATLKSRDFWGHGGEFASHDAAKADIEDIYRDLEERKSLGRIEARSSQRTPWGASQGVTHLGEGVDSHHTAGHGGYKLDRKRNGKVHPSIRQDGGWYEEDGHFAFVVHTFPELFTQREKRSAERIFINGYPDEWETVTGETLTEGQSLERDRQIFEARHAQDWVVISASGQPDGVHCTASLGGQRSRYENGVDIKVETAEFIVPDDEYATRSIHGFVIDPERHPRLEAAPTMRM